MGLKDKLENQGSQLSELDGQTPVIPNFQQSPNLSLIHISEPTRPY